MERFNTHITPEQIKEFLKKPEDTYWLTLADETCICYGHDPFNNPTDLPVYHTHDKGGVIVCFPDDISFGVISKDKTIGPRFTEYLKNYLSLKHTVEISHNDILCNGRKVASYSCLEVGNLGNIRYITTAHLSMQIDVGLIRKICVKPMLKIPGSLENFGYTKDELLDFVERFLKCEDPATNTENGPIDICVMWVDPSSERWRAQKEKYMQLEVKAGIQKPEEPGAFGEARYRDWGVFKYWFRGVEKACPWVHKIFLIVEDEDQVPAWLKKDHPKLRIVYHKEFIPEDCLPQYNGPSIEMWYSNIPDLSENFIACDDDYYFYNPIPSNWLFRCDIPQTSFETNTFDINKYVDPTKPWHAMLKNNLDFIKWYTHKNTNYVSSHLPEARKKSFEAKILQEYYRIFHASLGYSHFRSIRGYNAWLFVDLAKVLCVSMSRPVYQNSQYVPINLRLLMPNPKINDKSDMICFNDVDGAFDPNVQKKLVEILNNHFPEKSSFEL